MSVTELSGLPENPDCLHCLLPQVVDKFIREHPGKSGDEILEEFAQALGELIGSGAFNGGQTDCVPLLVNRAMRSAMRAALDIVNTLKGRRV
ncbi:MAG: hypothetical protein ACYDAE_28390 [Steroidobacteraceae bacterium]